MTIHEEHPSNLIKSKDDGITRCWYCGEPMKWESDADYSEVFRSGVDGIVSYLSCPKCGADAIFSYTEEKE